MDLIIDMECCACGCPFSLSIGGTEHGRVVKCPFCMDTHLRQTGYRMVEEDFSEEVFDASFEDRIEKRKLR